MRTLRPVCLLLILAVLATGTVSVLAQRGDDADRPSKNGKTEGTIDGVQVTLEYGRPMVNGRKIWGGLVPFAKVWRTGANEATAITFGADVTIEGQKLAAGTYELFTIPSEDRWTVIFNTHANQWGAYSYDAGKDVLRVDVPSKAAEHVEAMEFEIEGSSVVLRWEKLAVAFEVKKAS